MDPLGDNELEEQEDPYQYQGRLLTQLVYAHCLILASASERRSHGVYKQALCMFASSAAPTRGNLQQQRLLASSFSSRVEVGSLYHGLETESEGAMTSVTK